MSNPLATAADLLEAGWCQGTSATDADGNKVRWDSDGAARFCILGAISRSLPVWSASDYSELVAIVQRQLRAEGSSTISLPGWNDRDGRKKEEAVALVRRASVHLDELIA